MDGSKTEEKVGAGVFYKSQQVYGTHEFVRKSVRYVLIAKLHSRL